MERPEESAEARDMSIFEAVLGEVVGRRSPVAAPCGARTGRESLGFARAGASEPTAAGRDRPDHRSATQPFGPAALTPGLPMGGGTVHLDPGRAAVTG